jgi:hypothetical protein
MARAATKWAGPGRALPFVWWAGPGPTYIWPGPAQVALWVQMSFLHHI